MSAARQLPCVLFPERELPTEPLCDRDDCAGCTVRRLERLVRGARDELVITAGFAGLQAGDFSAAGQVHWLVIEAFRAIERDSTAAAERLAPHVRAATHEEATVL